LIGVVAIYYAIVVAAAAVGRGSLRRSGRLRVLIPLVVVVVRCGALCVRGVNFIVAVLRHDFECLLGGYPTLVVADPFSPLLYANQSLYGEVL